MVTVVDYDRIGTSDPIGKVMLGCNATGTGMHVYQSDRFII